MPEPSKADSVAVRVYSWTRTCSTSRVMPGSSDFSTSPTLLLIFIPLRSNGMWLPVTITPARPAEIAWEINAGVGILPAFSNWQPESTIAWTQARMIRSALGRRSPDNHCAARMNIANAQQIPERSFDIDVGFEV